MDLIGWLLFLFWFCLFLPMLFTVYFQRIGLRIQSTPQLAEWPRITIVVAARDEEKTIREGVGSLLKLDYDELKIVVVNDRSTDRTGEILSELANQDPRLTVIEVKELPQGWLGKNHALQIAAEGIPRSETDPQGERDFILFTDADVRFAPDTLRCAARIAVHNRLDLYCLFPSMVHVGPFYDALVSSFGLIYVVGTQPWLIRMGYRASYVGVGAFNLVRLSAYRAIGGHQQLKMDVIDDMKLGKLIKNAGFRQDCDFSDQRVMVPWYDSVWGIIKGLEKNCFAALGYSLIRLIGFSTLISLFLLPYVGVFWTRDLRSSGHLATLILFHGTYALYLLRGGANVLLVPLFPVAILTMVFIWWRSAIITLRQGGVRWRETFYPLDQLRAGLYRE